MSPSILCFFLIYICIIFQALIVGPSLILLVYYLPCLLSPFISYYFISFGAITSVRHIQFHRFITLCSISQLFFQLIQLISFRLSFVISFINQLIVPANLETSVFTNAGLTMQRFSGIFNQPLDAGVFGFLYIYILFIGIVPLLFFRPPVTLNQN